jgi:uncharacterized membrane protein YdcZ (DUF606 family)
VADNEPVYAPDQLKPGNRKWGRIGAVGTAVILIAMIFKDNREGLTEYIFLAVLAALLIGAVVLDVVLRRNGLKSDN